MSTTSRTVDEPGAFARLLRFWRTSLGRSQEQLAFELDSSPRHISRLETGRVVPSVEMVERIAATLGLGARDTSHLLFAAGHPPRPASGGIDAPELRWLRRTAAIMLRALDPYPAMLAEGLEEIRLVNRAWLGLLGDRIDPGAPDAVRRYFGFLLDATSREEAIGLDSQCGLLMTLQQEALIRGDGSLQDLVDGLASDHGLPADWVERAVRFEPVASFGLQVDVDGSTHRFFHMSQAVHPRGPSTYMAGAGLVVLTLLPDDQERDWSFLAARAGDHVRLADREVERGR